MKNAALLAAGLCAAWTPWAAAGETLPFRLHVLRADSDHHSCAVQDIDGDGRPDIFTAGWWYQAPQWQPRRVCDVPRIGGRLDDYSCLPLDVNGDGYLDFVSCNYRSQNLYWLEHPGPRVAAPDAPLWRRHVIDQPGGMETGRLYDIDGDGRPDVLPNGVRFAAWYQCIAVDARPEGYRWFRRDLPAEVAGHGVGFGDIDGDGRGDIVGPRGWLAAPDDRTRDRWVWHAEFDLGRDASIPILVLDVDADGDNDLVWARGHGIGLYWLEQLRPGRTDDNSAASAPRRWVRHTIDTSWSQAHALLIADLDGDGRPEVVAGKRYLGHDGRDLGEYDPLVIYAYTFLPETRTWQRRLVAQTYVRESPPALQEASVGFGLDPAASDADGDGDVDLVVADRGGLYLLENLHRAPPGAQPTAFVAPPPDYKDHAQLLVVASADGTLRDVTTPAAWARRRWHVLQHAQRVMGPLPDPSRRVPLDVQVLEETPCDGYVQQRITYAAEPGDRVPAYLLVPEKLQAPAPAMLCLHPTGREGKDIVMGRSARPNRAYAHELAQRGFVCLVPDYPSFGDYDYDFANGPGGYASGTMKAIWNNIRGVDLLESLPYVDARRIGAIGHSLGGHNAIFTAVFDQRIAAVVSSCGFTAFHHYYQGNLAGWTSPRYMPRIRDVYGNDPDRMPFDFYELVAALAPRRLFVCAPLHDGNFDVTGVRKVEAQAARVYDLLGSRDRLRFEYPDAGHDFPDAQRRAAYAWLENAGP